MSTKKLVAQTLDEIARYLELDGENVFKLRAFARAAESVRDLDASIEDLIESGDLDKTTGIGKTTAGVIREVVATGESGYLDDLRSRFPSGVLELAEIPGLGMKKVRTLYEDLGIGSLADLEKAITNDEVAALPGTVAPVPKRSLSASRCGAPGAGGHVPRLDRKSVV